MKGIIMVRTLGIFLVIFSSLVFVGCGVTNYGLVRIAVNKAEYSQSKREITLTITHDDSGDLDSDTIYNSTSIVTIPAHNINMSIGISLYHNKVYLNDIIPALDPAVPITVYFDTNQIIKNRGGDNYVPIIGYMGSYIISYQFTTTSKSIEFIP
jgi:hypothetical protein